METGYNRQGLSLLFLSCVRALTSELLIHHCTHLSPPSKPVTELKNHTVGQHTHSAIHLDINGSGSEGSTQLRPYSQQHAF